MRRLPLAFAVLAAIVGCQQREPADLVLYNLRALTMDDEGSTHEVIVVRDGRILATGGNDLRSIYRADQEEDLGGATVIPGFIDSHIHIHGWAQRYVHLPELESIAEISRNVREKAAELGPGEWITGYGWSEDELEEGRRPLRSDLDRAAPENPVLLTRAGGHSAVANSLALELAGLDRDSPDPEGGVLERDASGELNGIVRERQDILGRLVPPSTQKELRASFVDNLKDLFRHGITSIVQASESLQSFELWQSTYDELGNELPRAAVQLLWAGPEKMEAFGRKTGDGDERLRIGAVKIFVDGGFTGPAAFTIDPYKDQPNYHGKLTITPEALRDTIRQAHEAGWQLGIHAIGDAAIRLTVDELVAALEEHPRENHRHYLNHFTLRPPTETMKQMAAHDIAITQQPNFTYTLEGRYVANLDGERLETNNPLRTPMDHGIFVAISSDILPIGPMVGLYTAVTRRGMSGRVFGADEKLSIEEALRAYTRNGAYLTFEEDIKGTLEAGKLADFIVLSEDPRSLDPERLLELEVDATYLGGRLVYRRD